MLKIPAYYLELNFLAVFLVEALIYLKMLDKQPKLEIWGFMHCCFFFPIRPRILKKLEKVFIPKGKSWKSQVHPRSVSWP
jgi:hypothetical protein